MPERSSIRALSVRVALTLACVVGAGTVWPDAQPASAQTGKKCTNTGCEGVDRCVFYGSINCSMTYSTCTNSAC